MSEQLPDGFGQSDTLWGPDGRAIKQVPRISSKERDTFAHSGVDFDGFVEAEDRRAADKALTESILESMKQMDPDIKKLVE